MNNKVLERQFIAALDKSKEIIGSIQPVSYGDAVAVSEVISNSYEAYAAQLQQQELQLIEELHRIVIEYSGKIFAVRELKNHAIHSSGVNEGLRMAETE